MKDQIKNHVEPEENFSDALKSIVQKIEVSVSFKAELGKQLAEAHQPVRPGFGQSVFGRAMPAFGWVFALALMALVLNWMFRSIAPPPIPAAQETSSQATQDIPSPSPTDLTTPIPEGDGFDWRGTKLYLAQPLPQSPAEANVYLLENEQPATVELAEALATQFGIQGNVYETPGRLVGVPGYLVTDGKQRLYVHSALNYDYYSEYSIFSFLSGGKNISNEQASAAIDAFMKAHGMDFEYQIENAHQIPGAFYVVPLTPDGLSIRYEYNMPARFEFTVDDNGQVVLMSSNRVDYDSVGNYGIRPATEAFQQVLDTSNAIQNGVLEIMYSGGILNESFWQRTYPENQTVTIYGQPISYPAAEPGRSPFVSIGQYTAAGNVGGIENIDSSNYIEATGQFTMENGAPIFNVETWRILDSSEISISGTLRREGDEVILTAEDGSGEYVITDAPADLPVNTTIPDEYLGVNGFLIDGSLNWTSIQYFPSNAGGGGGGGTGLYQLNLSGTPVPFPSPTAQPKINPGSGDYTVKEGDTLSMIAENHGITVDELMQANGLNDPMIFIGQKLIVSKRQVTFAQEIALPEEQLVQLEIGQRIENERGIFQVNIYEESQRIEYGFFATALEKSDFPYLILEGNDLKSLQKYNNLPINIWGTVERFDQYEKPIVKIERYEIPFPDLDFQIIEGTQKMMEIEGKDVLTFTTDDGTTYVQIGSSVYPLDAKMLFGNEDNKLLMEVLIIPDEIYKGYPTLRMYSGNLAVDPISGKANELSVTANQFNTYNEPPATTEVYTPPTATIEKVELVYYVPNPLGNNPNPDGDAQYVQPAWRFYGHYSNGDEFEILVQALKEEYLLPELAPYTPPG